jgi:replicative DNA helicase
MEGLCDSGSERAVLASILQYGAEAYVEISDIITEKSFGSVNNQVIYRCLKRVIETGQEVDLPSILSAAETLRLTETIQTDQELNYIKSLSSFYINEKNIFSFALQIKKFEYARLIRSSNRLVP